MKKKIIQILLILSFVACNKNETNDMDIPEIPDESEIIVPAERVERTIIVYMAADNDLSVDAVNDIEEMKTGFLSVEENDKNTNLIVFIDPARADPYILNITQNGDTVRQYQEFVSTDTSQMRQILEDIIFLYPADKYGLVLWSHGTSWLPEGKTMKAFGRDDKKQMDIPDLNVALPLKFEFILFDACLMGAIEVVYELRNKADFIIASSAEIIYLGFPYDEIIPELIKPVIDLNAVAQKYFAFYNVRDGAYRSATISLVDTKELENLARETAKLASENEINDEFDRNKIQQLDTYSEQYTFDFADFISKIFPSADKTALMTQLDKTVLYKANTPAFLDEYPIETYCGLSCYIPVPARNDLNSYYQTLQWFNDSGYEMFFQLIINRR
jgi:hypothetical protein